MIREISSLLFLHHCLFAQTEGLVCRFEEALEQLTNFETKKTKPTPWKCCLEIGPDISIPIMSYIKVSVIFVRYQRAKEFGSLK